jgi:ATP dependent DNA ligase domain/ATP dependent DNA ligase C terminal region
VVQASAALRQWVSSGGRNSCTLIPFAVNSNIYSPVIGPALRRALSKYDCDCILDGEILAWDDERQENVEFGNNRTVANLRRKWMQAHGKIEAIDENLHEGEEGDKVMTPELFKAFDNAADDDTIEGGDRFWMKFVAFDVLYCGGPGAEDCLKHGLPAETEPTEPGSITHLTLFERKKLLYHMLEVQRNEVEVVASIVIRPNGDYETAKDYFASTTDTSSTNCDHPKYVFDSVKWTLNSAHWTPVSDMAQRKGREDMEISKRRTRIVDEYYHMIVDEQKKEGTAAAHKGEISHVVLCTYIMLPVAYCEGLVLKDLAAPYILKVKSKAWLKIKPDYAKASFASDIDVVVIGGSWAVGNRRSGQLSGFLCGCSDSKDPAKFFTFCRINAKSLNEAKLAEIMAHTQFKPATKESPLELGKWFQGEEDGKKTIPDFISNRSFQSGKEDNGGWRFANTKFYPDLFIHPENSVVLKINASEIVGTDEYSAGLTLRFPRATEVRFDKPVRELESEADMYRMRKHYLGEMRKHASASSSSFEIVSPSKRNGSNDERICRFYTVEQHSRAQKNRKESRKKARRVKAVNVEEKTDTLAGFLFCVLPGAYSIGSTGPHATLAKEEGWFEDACLVQGASDVEAFVVRNGGKIVQGGGLDVYTVGGSSAQDFIVQRYVHGTRCYILTVAICLSSFRRVLDASRGMTVLKGSN